MDAVLRDRILSGEVRRGDVVRRLAELAFGEANDCVRLVQGETPEIAGLDLSHLCEVKRSEKGAVEVKLVDRLQALEQLSLLVGQEEGLSMEEFLGALQGGKEA